MNILCISDTHGRHRNLKLPKAELLLFAGDMGARSFLQLEDFTNWLAAIDLPAERKIIIAGNNDGVFEQQPQESRKYLDGIAIYLENSSCTVDGINIYGTPVSLAFRNLFFNIPDDGNIQKYWDMIPQDTDILITHQPPFGILDSDFRKKHLGCPRLFARVKEIKPRLHCFGHIHGGYGAKTTDGTTFVNASVCNDFMKISNKAILVKM